MLAGTVATCLLLAAFLPAPAQTAAHSSTTARHHTAAKPKPKPKARSRAKRPAAPAEAGISNARALQIQNALMRAGYLDQASGHWDTASRAAMTRYQDDHHWQTRYVPDARALIALGLGPAMDGVPPTAAAHITTADTAPDPGAGER